MATEQGSDDDRRPKPAYGEYAPEGWEWKPDGSEDAANADNSSPATPGNTPAGLPATGTPSTPAPDVAPAGTRTVPGVPHNLGVGSALPPRSTASKPQQDAVAPTATTPSSNQPSQTAQLSPGAPYRASAPNAADQQRSTQAPSRKTATNVKPPRGADKVVTILLLVAGLFGALQSGFAMIGLSGTFRLIASAPGFEDFVVPGWLDPTGKVIGIALLAFYGIVLVYSIRRLRSGKLTFWVPLAAGAIVTLLVMVVVFIAILTTPDLVTMLSDPEKSAALIEYLQGQATP